MYQALTDRTRGQEGCWIYIFGSQYQVAEQSKSARRVAADLPVQFEDPHGEAGRWVGLMPQLLLCCVSVVTRGCIGEISLARVLDGGKHGSARMGDCV